jgi:membrane-bound lytic murein transglycosylase F
MIYQESKFDPYASSRMNATGLMQMMPETALRFGVKDIHNPQENLLAGTKYLSYLSKLWSSIPDSLERIKFVLASYNVGEGHILDARRLAEKYNKNPNIWDEHVAEYVALLDNPTYYRDEVVRNGFCRGKEPYKYVKEVFDRYRDYKNAGVVTPVIQLDTIKNEI